MNQFHQWGRRLVSGAGIAALIVAVGCTSTKAKRYKVLEPRAGVPAAYVGPRTKFALTGSKVRQNQAKKTFKKDLKLTKRPTIKLPKIKTRAPKINTVRVEPLPDVKNKPLLTYKVKRGDTLSHIALAHKVGVDELAAQNKMNKNDILHVGKVLRIPRGGVRPNGPVRTASSKSNLNSYKVQKGDYLGKIAKNHGCTVSQLKAWNGLTSDMIYVGQKLYLEPGGKVRSRGGSRKLTKSSIPASGIHTVKSGESLSTIGYRYGLSVSELQRLNGLTTSHIVPGQKLFLKGNATVSRAERTIDPKPSKSAKLEAGGKYIVQKGDSLWKIARKFGVSVKNIMENNGLNSQVIMPGITLVIPGKSKSKGTVSNVPHVSTKQTQPKSIAKVDTAPAPAPAPKDPMETVNARVKNMTKLPHFVDQANDTLREIADMYGSKIDWILAANPNIKADKDLKAVKEIQVPVEELNIK